MNEIEKQLIEHTGRIAQIEKDVKYTRNAVDTLGSNHLAHLNEKIQGIIVRATTHENDIRWLKKLMWWILGISGVGGAVGAINIFV